MLHLFKEVYISFDDTINSRVPRVVISKENGHADMLSPNLLGHAEQYSDLIGNGKQYPTLLELLKLLSTTQTTTGEAVHVYMDKAAFTTFCANWFKAIFENGTAESSYQFLSGHLSEMFMPSVDPKSPKMSRKFRITQSEFTTAYNSTTEDYESYAEFMQSVSNELSIELLVASYLANGSVKSILGQRLCNMELSDIESFMKEAKSDIYRGLLFSVFTTDNGLRSYTSDTLEDIVTDPGMSFFWPIYNDVVNNYRLGSNSWTSINAESIDALYNRMHAIADSKFGCFASHGMKRLKLLAYISEKTLSDESFDALMQFEIEAHNSFHCAKYSKFNAYFMDYILEPIRTGGASTVAPYAIRGCK